MPIIAVVSGEVRSVHLTHVVPAAHILVAVTPDAGSTAGAVFVSLALIQPHGLAPSDTRETETVGRLLLDLPMPQGNKEAEYFGHSS
jgi:hypothetical protein